MRKSVNVQCCFLCKCNLHFSDDLTLALIVGAAGPLVVDVVGQDERVVQLDGVARMMPQLAEHRLVNGHHLLLKVVNKQFYE